MSKTILVLGSPGNVGVPLVRALAEAGATVRAASRKGSPVAGAIPVRFDYADPATFGPALDGADAVYVLAPTGTVDAPAVLNPVIDAAVERGAKVVLQTAFGVNTDDAIPLRQVERRLEGSGVPHVILRPNWFADNFHLFWVHDIRQGRIAVPAADGRSAFIDARDIALAAAGALTQSQFDGQAIDLTGPAALSYAEAAAVLSEATGRPIRYEPTDDPTFVANLVAGGVPSAYATFLAAIFYPVREGWTAAVTDGVERLSGRPGRTLADYARDNAHRLA